jgi:hypothetical protein
MTRNRTPLDLFPTFGTELLVLLLLTLAIGLAVSNYMMTMREGRRRSDLALGKRASRRPAA